MLLISFLFDLESIKKFLGRSFPDPYSQPHHDHYLQRHCLLQEDLLGCYYLVSEKTCFLHHHYTYYIVGFGFEKCVVVVVVVEVGGGSL